MQTGTYVPTTTEEGTDEDRTKGMPTLWTESTPRQTTLLMVSQENLHTKADAGTQDHGHDHLRSHDDRTGHTGMEVSVMSDVTNENIIDAMATEISALEEKVDNYESDAYVLSLLTKLDELQGDCDLTHDLLDVAITKLNKLEKK